MAVHYNTQEKRIAPELSQAISKRAGDLVLCNFNNAEDLLFGMDALKVFNIPVYEVYSPVHIGRIRSKLDIKRLKTGYAILKYGLFGGASIAPVIGYALDHNWDTTSLAKNIPGMVPIVFLIVLTFLLASRLPITKPPEIIKLSPNDRRFLIVVKTKNIIPDEKIASFLQYSGAVEITQAVKRLLLA